MSNTTYLHRVTSAKHQHIIVAAFYVVARLSGRLVVYNDVEEILGIGTLSGSGTMTDSTDYGPLVLALRALIEEVPTASLREPS
jgi:hypothetical protein